MKLLEFNYYDNLNSNSILDTPIVCNGTVDDCSGHGTCVNGACQCISLYLGTNCETHFEQKLSGSYKAFRYIFLTIFVILVGVTSFQAYKSFSFWKTRKLVYRLKFINHIVVLIYETLRIIYFITDPWGYSGYISRSSNEVLYNFPIYFLFSAYIILLIYWCHTYSVISHKLKRRLKGNVNSTDEVTANKKRQLLKAIPVFIFINIVWFIFEIIRIVLGSIGKNKGSFFNNAYNAWVGIACFATLICFSIYGSQLIKKIKLLPTPEKDKNETVKRLTIITICVSVSIFISILPPLLFFFLGLYSTPKGMLTNSSVVHGIEVILTLELLYIMKPKEVFNNNNSDSDKSKKNKSSNITKTRSESVSYYRNHNNGSGTSIAGSPPNYSPRNINSYSPSSQRYSKEIKDFIPYSSSYNDKDNDITQSNNNNGSPTNILTPIHFNGADQYYSSSISNGLNSSNDDIINHQDHISNTSSNNDNSNVTTENETELIVIHNHLHNNNLNDNNNIQLDNLPPPPISPSNDPVHINESNNNNDNNIIEMIELNNEQSQDATSTVSDSVDNHNIV